MHRFMECLDFSLLGEADSEEVLHKELERLLKHGLMKKEDVDLLDLKKLISFLDSDLAVDMKKANQNQKLKKEQPFVMGDTPKNLLADLYPDQEYPDDEKAPMVLIQGIIDAFYINDDGIVLVDYKTDRVSSGEELILKYREQMDLYQRAIEKSFHQKVVKRVLYSFSLGEEVVL